MQQSLIHKVNYLFSVTKQDNECPQQTNTAEHYVEDVDEEEEEEEYEDYDPKDEDYVPPGI